MVKISDIVNEISYGFAIELDQFEDFVLIDYQHKDYENVIIPLLIKNVSLLNHQISRLRTRLEIQSHRMDAIIESHNIIEKTLSAVNRNLDMTSTNIQKVSQMLNKLSE
jgi:hypothetical protein